jgi:vanillate O-demethylase monooxygenase subunit
VLRSADLLHNAPQRVMLLGEPYVLTRINNTLTAFVDKCPHRNARLSDGCVVGEHLQCPYHGWEFTAQGDVAHVPALGKGATLPPNTALSPARVVEKYNLVWLAPEDPVTDIINISEWNDASLRHVWLEPITINAAAAQFIDNFLDFGHFPFVHAGTFGSGEDANIHEYSVEKDESGWGFVVNYEHTIENNEDPLVATGEHPLVQPRIMRYEFTAPFSCNLRLSLPTTCLYSVMLRNDCPTDALAQAAAAYEMDILAEDLKVIEGLYDKVVPLERGQVHTRADRNTVEFRRIMQRLLGANMPS